MSQRLLEASASQSQPGSPALATPPRAPAADPRRRLTALFDRVRRRLRRRDLLLGGVAWTLFTLGSSAGLMLLAALFGPAPLWRPLCGAWLIAVLFALAIVIVRATRAPLDDAAIARLDEEFADLVVRGGIERVEASPSEVEDGDVPDLPRVALHFDRSSFARLRLLIDAINAEGRRMRGEPAAP